MTAQARVFTPAPLSPPPIAATAPIATPARRPLWLPRLQGLDPVHIAAGLVFAVILLCAAAPGLITSYRPTDMDYSALLQAPNAAHLLGTDNFGRDILALITFGARQSLMIACGAVLVGLTVGGLLGLIAGFAGRTVDLVIMRAVDLWMSIPDILLVLVIATALTPSFTNIILTIGVVSAPRYARVMRAQVVALQHRPFVAASRAIGTPASTILLRHILPHTLSPMLVLATLGIATATLMAASLSFIGLGVIDDRPDWGYLLNQARSYLGVAWWFGAFPGLAITALAVSANLLGDAARRRFDPYRRGR